MKIIIIVSIIASALFYTSIIKPVEPSEVAKNVYPLPQLKMTLDKHEDDPMTTVVQVKLGLAYNRNNHIIVDEIAQRKEQISDIIIKVITGKRYEEISTSEGRNVDLKKDLLNSINEIMIAGKIEDIYYETFEISRIHD